MNWIIEHSNKLRWQTDFTALFKPIYGEIEKYNWIVSDLDYSLINAFELHDTQDSEIDIPINFEHPYFILSPEQLKKVINTDIQLIWGVILGIPRNIEIAIDKSKLPYADGNKQVWENGEIQHQDAIIEIICFDSSYTIIKFKDRFLSDKFKRYFDEAIDLERFTSQY